MATTTNYGWTTPDDTALVKDGAAAIRTLGSSVDTTTKNLNPSTTLGDIEYRSSTSNTNTRLGIGTTGQVLSVSGGVPAWATPTSGGMTLISETVASANSSLSFSSLGNYKQLYLIWSGIKTSDNSTAFGLRLNNSSSSIYVLGGHSQRDTTSVYTGSTNSHFSVDVAGVPVTPFGNGSNSATLNRQAAGEFLIDNYTSTTKSKSVKGCWNFTQDTSPSYFFTGTGFFNSTSAVTTIDIFRLSGSGTFSNDSNTTIRLYGIS